MTIAKCKMQNANFKLSESSLQFSFCNFHFANFNPMRFSSGRILRLALTGAGSLLFSHGRLARRLELVTRFPFRQLRILRRAKARVKQELRVLDGSREVPRLVVLVARLVILRRLPSLNLFLPPTFWPADEIGTCVQEHSRYADLREIELV